jgi:hypothetical protein
MIKPETVFTNLNSAQVVDGKQRINAILGWLEGHYEAICPCGETFWFNQADEITRRGLGLMTTLKMHFVTLRKIDVLKFYLSLNSGGTVHAAADLDKVRAMLRALENQQPPKEGT